jgi:hypothetical protein
MQESDVSGHDQPETSVNCHYIAAQLQLIRDANVGASDRLSSVGSTGLDEQLHAMESAIARIRDEMGRRALVKLRLGAM